MSRPVCVERAKDDPRYHRDVDDPGGNGDERILAQPIAGSDGQIHAVVIAIRTGNVGDELVRYTAENTIDLAIVGGADDHARKLLDKGRCSVLVLR